MKYIKYYISLAYLVCYISTIISSATPGSLITRGSSPCVPVKLEPENKELFVLLRRGEMELLATLKKYGSKYNKLVALLKKGPDGLEKELIKIKKERDGLVERCEAFQQLLGAKENNWRLQRNELEEKLQEARKQLAQEQKELVQLCNFYWTIQEVVVPEIKK